MRLTIILYAAFMLALLFVVLGELAPYLTTSY